MKRTACLCTILLLAALRTPASSQSLEAITRPQKGRSMRASSGKPNDNADSAKFGVGETRTVAKLTGPGKIAHIWLTPSSLDIRYPRALVLRMSAASRLLPVRGNVQMKTLFTITPGLGSMGREASLLIDQS